VHDGVATLHHGEESGFHVGGEEVTVVKFDRAHSRSFAAPSILQRLTVPRRWEEWDTLEVADEEAETVSGGEEFRDE
jgi:hypothetical protein